MGTGPLSHVTRPKRPDHARIIDGSSRPRRLRAGPDSGPLRSPAAPRCRDRCGKPEVLIFVIELKTSRVDIAWIHPQPDGRWMAQMARKLTDPVDGFLRTARQLMHDRDPLYTRGCGEILTRGDGGPLRLPPTSPKLNADAERFVRSSNEEGLPRVVPLGEGYLRLIVHEYVEHDQRESNHQGLDTQLLPRPPPPVRTDADVQRRERLGGLLSVYSREAA